MKWTTYRNRRVAEIENDELLVTVTAEGGHVARILHKESGVNPLWTPHWPSIEPSQYNREEYPEFGDSNEAQLVAGLLGHNVCLDLFGAPSPSEATAGIPVHGEAPVATYDIDGNENTLVMRVELPLAQLRFEREIRLAEGGVVHFRERLKNLSTVDRPIGWTQHVTLGAPFLEPGQTQFLLSAGPSRVADATFNSGLGMNLPDSEFEWPWCPMRDGSVENLSVLTSQPVSGGFTAHRMEPNAQCGSFAAWSPATSLLIGYAWHPKDFPWLSRWEENHLRPWAPWNSKGFALGMEFGVSPFVKDRRGMVELGRLFDTPTFCWLGALEQKEVDYIAYVQRAKALPQSVHWSSGVSVTLG